MDMPVPGLVCMYMTHVLLLCVVQSVFLQRHRLAQEVASFIQKQAVILKPKLTATTLCM
jgi:hypothetical protein